MAGIIINRMDRRQVLGFVLLGILFVGFLLVQSRIAQREQVAEAMKQDSLRIVRETFVADSIANAKKQQEQVQEKEVV